MSWLARLFQDIGDLFYWVYYYVAQAGMWIEDNVGWSGLANIFYDIAYYFGEVWMKCYDVADELDAWWDKITETASDLSSLWNYVSGWLTDRINDAVNAAESALSRANQAINDAAAAFQKAISEAAAALAAAKEYAETLITDIGGWIEAHALDVYNAIKGYITDIAAWVTAHSVDIWDAIKGHLVTALGIQLALIAAPINLVNLWFDSIQGFFNDPWGWLEAQFEGWFERNW